jgi:outer membrane protein
MVANRRAARAGIDAADADIGASAATVRAAVTQQYINALQQDARVRLQDTLLISARSQLELARARVAVGAATPLDARRAEVSVGQVEVARLQAANQAEVERLRLFQQLGVEPRAQVRLTTTFALTTPPLSLDALLAQARAGSPTLNAFRARERQAQLNVGAARSQYLPSFNLQLGLSGFTQQSTDINQTISQQQANAINGRAQCEQQQLLYTRVGLPFTTNCGNIAFTPAQEAAIRSGNRAYPFNFTRNPYNLSAFISLPIFNGFQREQQVQVSQASERDAEYRRRSEELRLTADVTASYRTLLTDQRAAELQQRNVQVAREALSLAEERYRVGAGTFVDVAQSRGDYERAQNDYINAVYQFQRDFAALENAVGRPLR